MQRNKSTNNSNFANTRSVTYATCKEIILQILKNNKINPTSHVLTQQNKNTRSVTYADILKKEQPTVTYAKITRNNLIHEVSHMQKQQRI